MEAGAIILVAILLIVIVTIFMGVKTVPQGSEWTVERFGRYTRTLQPGSPSSSRTSTRSAASSR